MMSIKAANMKGMIMINTGKEILRTETTRIGSIEKETGKEIEIIEIGTFGIEIIEIGTGNEGKGIGNMMTDTETESMMKGTETENMKIGTEIESMRIGTETEIENMRIGIEKGKGGGVERGVDQERDTETRAERDPGRGLGVAPEAEVGTERGVTLRRGQREVAMRETTDGEGTAARRIDHQGRGPGEPSQTGEGS